eukprot:50333-Rhodomonas_salina.1
MRRFTAGSSTYASVFVRALMFCETDVGCEVTGVGARCHAPHAAGTTRFCVLRIPSATCVSDILHATPRRGSSSSAWAGSAWRSQSQLSANALAARCL